MNGPGLSCVQVLSTVQAPAFTFVSNYFESFCNPLFRTL